MPGMDFNGDGRADILWRNTNNGNTSNWLGTETGGFLVNDAVAMDPWAVGNLTAVGDFNGDGRTDTLWRYDDTEIHLSFTAPDGALYFQWTMGFVAEVAVSWQVAGAGDFDGDGLDDILWASNDGRISNWLSDGDYTFIINDANAMTTIGSTSIRGIADFNADGSDDVLVRQGNGSYDLYWAELNGGFQASSNGAFSGTIPNWEIAGVGDFNGDGAADLLWRNTATGAISTWIMDTPDYGTQSFIINDANAFVNVPFEWQIAGIGDYNGDGYDDLLWRNRDTGTVSDWLSNGSWAHGWTVNDAVAMHPAPLEWIVQPHMIGAHLFDV